MQLLQAGGRGAAGLLALGTLGSLFCAPLRAQVDTANHWPLGSRIRTNNTVYARADSTATGAILCPCPHGVGDKGTLIGGPVGPVADGSIRWKIQYDVPPSGWSTQHYLSLDSTVAPPPPPPPPAPPPAPPPSGGQPTFVDMSVPRVGLTVGQSWQVSGVPYDSAHQITGTAVVWTVQDTTLGRVTPLGRGVSQVAVVSAQRPGTTFVQARAGAAMGQLQLLVLPPAPVPPPPPPAPPVFGVSTTRWVGLTNCLPVIGTTCTRIFPILADSDGHILVRATVVATFAPP